MKANLNDMLKRFSDKTWIIPNYSALGDRNIEEVDKNGMIYLKVETEAFRFNAPRRFVVQFKGNYIGSLRETVERELALHLWDRMIHPIGIKAEKIVVFVRANSERADATSLEIPISFVHGVKNSPPLFLGDNDNPLHGHTAFFSWTHTDLFKKGCFSCQAGVQQLMTAVAYLDGAVLVSREDIMERSDTEMKIGYQGIELTLKTAKNKIVVIDGPTNVEALLMWFVKQFEETLKAAHIDKIFLTYGEKSGSVIHLGY